MSNFKELVRLGKDAETRHTQGGKVVTGFSAAFDTGWGDNKKTVWLDCSWWGDRATKVVEYLTKGTQIVVEGDIGTREYEGKTYITLDVREVKLVGGKPSAQSARDDRSSGGGTGGGGGGGRNQSAPVDDFSEDPIPF